MKSSQFINRRIASVLKVLSGVTISLLLLGCQQLTSVDFVGSPTTPPPTPVPVEADAETQKDPAKKPTQITDDPAIAINLEELSSERSLFSAVPAPAIPTGFCGMILWTLDDQQPTPILRYIVGEGATISLAGSVAPLTLVDTAGASRYGVAEEQAFTGEGGIELNVRVSFGLGFDGGQYLERGILVIEDSRGWRNVTPAAGLAGCRRS